MGVVVRVLLVGGSLTWLFLDLGKPGYRELLRVPSLPSSTLSADGGGEQCPEPDDLTQAKDLAIRHGDLFAKPTSITTWRQRLGEPLCHTVSPNGVTVSLWKLPPLTSEAGRAFLEIEFSNAVAISYRYYQ